MTPEEYRNKLKADFAKQELGMQKAFLLSVKDVIGAQVVRIFEEGKNSNDSKIGAYQSNKEMWISDDASPRKGTHKGKPNAQGKSKKITTTYYESYKGFRGEQGRESGFVNLRLNGRLMSDLANAPVDRKDARIPSDIKPTKVNGFEYYTLIRGENVVKKQGAEAKYGKIFSHTKGELERFNRTLKFELSRV
jgi:hypothetical protein